MTILCYHSVDPDWESPLAARPEEFEQQCAWLARHRRVIPLPEAIDRLDASGRLPRGEAVLTFDDGFADNLTRVLPVVQRYGLPFTIFLVAETLTPGGRPVDWVKTAPAWPLQTLTVDEVHELADAGVDLQSHSWAHRDLPDLDHEACVADLRSSREFLEDLLKRPVPFLAYPRGLHDEGVRKATEQAGYTHGFTLPEGPELPGPYAVPRVGIHRGNGTRALTMKTSRAYLPLRHGHVGNAARRARRVVNRLR